MREIIPRIADDTYDALQYLTEKCIDSQIALQQACDMYPWVSDLIRACFTAVQRNEFLKHNKSTAHIHEKHWLKVDCERYNTTVEAFLAKYPHATSIKGDEPINELPGISINDPEYDYMLAIAKESHDNERH